MLRFVVLLFAAATALAAQPIRDLALDPTQAVDLPVSREITTVMFPGGITAVAGADSTTTNTTNKPNLLLKKLPRLRGFMGVSPPL